MSAAGEGRGRDGRVERPLLAHLLGPGHQTVVEQPRERVRFCLSLVLSPLCVSRAHVTRTCAHAGCRHRVAIPPSRRPARPLPRRRLLPACLLPAPVSRLQVSQSAQAFHRLGNVSAPSLTAAVSAGAQLARREAPLEPERPTHCGALSAVQWSVGVPYHSVSRSKRRES